jgi:hypothetical protein
LFKVVEMTRKFGLLSVLLVALPVMAAPPSAISGYVKSVSGVPQMGAVVEIFTSAALVGTRVFTDAKGYYSADDLQPGIYQIKVTAASFLPSLRENVNVRTGTRVLVNLTLSTLADALQLLPPRWFRRGRSIRMSCKPRSPVGLVNPPAPIKCESS